MFKLFFFLGLAAAIVLFAKGCDKTGDFSIGNVILPDSTKAAIAKSEAPANPPNPDPLVTTPSVRPARLVQEPEPETSFLVGSYEFRNRLAPALNWDAAGKDGGFLLVSGQNWIWRLPVTDAASIALLAQRLDRARRSYSVQAVAVAVSTSLGADVNIEGMLRSLAENVQHLTTLEIAGGVLAIRGTRANLISSIDIEAGKQRMRTVTAPTGVIIDDGEMSIEAGTQVPIPVLATDERSTRSGVEFRRVGFSFVIKVRELSTGAVVDVTQTAGRLGRVVQIEGNDVPSFEEETLKTSLGLQPGLWYLVGGLKSESTDRELSILRLRATKETSNIYLFIRIDPL